MDKAVPAFVLASLAIRCRFVDRFAEPKVSSRVSRQRLSSRGAPFPRAGPGEPSSPRSAVLWRRYDFPPTHPRSLICFASGVRAILRSSCSPWRRSRMIGGPIRARAFGQPAAHLPAHSHWTQAGSRRFPGDPSHAFAPVQDPGRTDDPHPDGVVDAAPAQPTAKAPAIIISRLLTRLQHLLPTLHDGRRRTPCKARFRLVG